MKHYLLLTTALAGLSIMAPPLALAQSGGGADVPVTPPPTGGTTGDGGGGTDAPATNVVVNGGANGGMAGGYNATITTTTTTTHSYDFPDSDPVVSTSTTTANNCPPVYYGGGGGGGGNNGGGMGGYADTTGDGFGDTYTEQEARATTGHVSSGYGGLTGSASMGGGNTSGGGGGSSDGGRVICTHFYQKGEMSELYYFADIEFTRRNLHPSIIRGYHAWGIWYVERMRQNPGGLMERLMRPIALHRANEIAYRMGLRDTPDRIGRLVRVSLEPLCFVIGLFAKERDWRRLYAARDFSDFAAGYRRYTALKTMRLLNRHKQAVYAGQVRFTGSYRGAVRPRLELYKVFSSA